MRLAILADIHANLPALEAVLRDVAGRGVEGVLHLGDLVGYGPHPDAVVARVREQQIGGVVGNYDLAVCHPDAREGAQQYLRPDLSEEGWRTYCWTRERVGAATREVLATLPAQLRIEEGERVFLFTHGSPERPNEYLRPETPEPRLQELFEGSGADVLVVGHTHLPQAREVGSRLLLNPGSVGNPKDGDPRASYLILDTDRGLTVEHMRVEFAVETVGAERVDSAFPAQQGEALRRGRGV
ncbi:MAG: metallophosphoesterase family protein [Deferrisomatales bacterium]|nr:metallophosphoesterase family protein [Deferrisomatales bacterium]